MKRIKLPKLSLVVSAEIILLATGAAFFLPGGEDLYRFYLPFAQGCLECGFNPWHTSWILFPLTLIPARIVWSVWVGVTLTGLAWASQRLKTNPAFVLLAFPTMGLIWLGQIEVLIVLGLMLALLSPNPYMRGVGLVLASIKPQVAGIAILVLFWYETERLKTSAIPLAILAVSMLVWGPAWPINWLLSDPEPGQHVWRSAHLYPFGLIAFLAIFVVKTIREKVLAALLASSIALPWFGVYSQSVFLVFFAPWWALPVSYAWIVAYPFMGNLSMQFAWILPFSLLICLVWSHVRTRWETYQRARHASASIPDQEVV